MNFKKMDFLTFNISTERKLSIIISDTSLMINETKKPTLDDDEPNIECETIQLESEEMAALYQALHKTFSNQD